MRSIHHGLTFVGFGFVCALNSGCTADGSIGGLPGKVAHDDDAATSIDAGSNGEDAPATRADGGATDPPTTPDASTKIRDAGSTQPSPDSSAPTPSVDGGPGDPSADAGAPTPPVDAAPTDPLEAARQQCVDLINGYRATLSLPAYTRWTANEACVDGQAAADGAANTAHSAFGTCNEFAQNECPGWPGPPSAIMTGCLQMMWNEGPGSDFEAHGHYINMSNPDYTMVACGFHQMPDGSWWATQDFK